MASISNQAGGWTPTRADLDAATARTAGVMASDASPRVREAAAALEADIHAAFLKRPDADAELQREAELEACA